MQRYLQSLHLLFLTCAIGLTACGGGETKKPRVRTLPQGSIESSINQLTTSRFEECDHKYHSKRIEIARELDRRSAEIIKVSAELPRPDYNKVAVGSINFLVPKTAPVKEAEDIWKTSTMGWEALVDYFDNIRDTPTDRRWIALDSVSRGILVDDYNRINRQENFYLGRSQKNALKTLYDDLRACFIDVLCTTPVLSPTANQLYLSNPQYRRFHETVRMSPRENLELLYDWVRIDYEDHYKLLPKSTVTRIDESTFEVKVYAGTFEEGKTILADWFAEKWQTFGFQAQISWVDHSDISNPYELLHSIHPGRAYVDYTNRVMQLFGEPRKSTFLHEMGHILGLRDRYYTTWNPSTCEYTTEYNEGDIMSDSDGNVTLESWEELNEMYPVSITP